MAGSNLPPHTSMKALDLKPCQIIVETEISPNSFQDGSHFFQECLVFILGSSVKAVDGL